MGRKWKSVVAMVVSLMMLLTIVPMSVCAMQIFIKVAVDDGYDHYTLEVEPTDRIEDIRIKIYEKKGSPIYQQVLTFAGKVLEDGNSLQDYSIQKDSTINLTLKAHMNDITIVNADYIEDDIYWFGKGKGPTVIPAPGYVISNQENGTYGDSVSFQQGDVLVVYLKNARGEKLEGLDFSKHIKFDTEAPVIHDIEDGGKYYGMNVFSFEDTTTGIASLEIDGVETAFSPMEPTIYITPDNAEHVIVVTDKVGNVTTYTVFVYKTYCVTYVVDGKKIDEQYVGYGKDAIAPEIPAKEGYTDTPPTWGHDGKNIIADTEIYAVYTQDLSEESETEEPEIEEPQVEEPEIEEPQIEEPEIEVPQIEEPEIEELQIEEPGIEEPQIEEPKKEKPETENTQTENAQTGDGNNLWLWFSLLFMSGTSIFGIAFTRRKRR